MKIIDIQLIIEGIRSRKDGSLGLSVSTPELTVEDKVELMQLQGQVLDTRLRPIDSPEVPEYKVNSDLNQKTPSQRLRAVLFILHQQSNSQESFESFYNQKMEGIIEAVKGRLE